MVSKAILRNAKITARKARRVVDLIRGKRAAEALLSLRYMPYRGARSVEKLLKSAMSNAEQKNTQVDIDKLKIKTAFVDSASFMKRMEPRSMGRANVLKKRSCHITIILSEE